MLATSICAAAIAGCGGGSDPKPGLGPTQVPPDQVLRRELYMGVSCPTPNALACDRVGLSIVLREPAATVTATIGERHFDLNDPAWSGRKRDGERKRFAGFLQPAGLREPGPLHVVSPDPGKDHWIGRSPVYARVELLITGVDGMQTATSTRVWLAPGWG